ncbi:MAG TPA: hypothetical protein VKZ55_08235 [Microthrixaceae bacterium]|nr:hypothetical protein [Microthrixaceae bacterium]
MRFDETDLLQDLLIFDVQRDGQDVHVDLYGGRDNVCGSVRFTFPDPVDRRRNLAQLREWQRDEVPVALLSYGDTITLLSERALLDRCLQQTS